MRIPGRVSEIRYQRTGRDRGPYRHTFTTPVRMIARRDGSVVLRGHTRVWADEDRPGFSRYTRPRRKRPMQRRYRRNPGGSSGGMGSLMPLALIGGAIWLLSRPGGIGGLFQSSGTGVPSTVDAFTRSQGRAPFSQAEADSWAQGPEYQGMLRAAGVTRGTSSPTNPSDLGTAFQLSLVKAGVPAATGLVSAAISNWFKLLGSGQNAAGVPTAVGNPESASTALAAYRAGEHADPWAAPLPSDPFYQDPWAAPLSVPDLQAAGMMDYAAPVDYSAPFDLSAGSAMTIADAEMALSGFTI